MSCGREPEGDNVSEFGICPASTEARLHSVHGGQNAGRACWVVAGTYCHGKVQGTHVEKEPNCLACPFHRSVRSEHSENGDFMSLVDLLSLLEGKG